MGDNTLIQMILNQRDRDLAERHVWGKNRAPRPIPKKLHLIWVGDDAKRPQASIDSWRDKHPTWQFQLWGNAELDGIPWKAKRQIDIFRAGERWEGVADLMRYEILLEHGGVYVDADSTCVRPLDDWLLDTRMFAVWENERCVPGLIANGFIGSQQHHPVLSSIVRATARMNDPMWRRTWDIEGWRGIRPRFRYAEFLPWKSVGPMFFTKMILPFCPGEATILPSVLFLPRHHTEQADR
ncbi:MAG TPA: glycosyltransferase, partial [Rhizomicrobium sp.]|nr:glycosyltransferase [Rhizomicrobium sp.]